MNLQQAELYQRIQAFSLDNPHDSLSFSKRLACENKWSVEYTQRVIQEYKKFVFLAVVAGHPVSPSEQVDQAWHLHLTYTRSYWEEFCSKVLGTPLHHEPTRGGNAEQEKFDDWYNQTLASYTAWFGEAPPTDIWPPAHLRFAQEAELIQVDPQHYWVLSKLKLPKPAIPLLALILALAIVGCTPLMRLELENPLNFRGPEFLGFYMMLAIPVVGFASLLRWLLRFPSQGAVASSDLDLYEIAFLAAGRERAVETAIVQLVQHRYLQPKSKIQALSVTEALPKERHPLEQAVETAARANGSVYHIRGAVTNIAEEVGDRLRERGLLLPYWRAFLAQWVPALSIIALLVLGISKISVGLERHKPVGFLMILCLFTAFAAIRCLTPVGLSRFGQQVVQTLLQQNASLKQAALNSQAKHSPVGLAFALFGTASLSSQSFADLRFVLSHSTSSSSSSFDGGGGCGSSGCSSGSCGGGCSGGGCGGCGG
ncbi:MAG: TIGR04222 domain-containing membrane protein [Trichocoleus desertorum ATA4-8-CV12]|jgi:uncharacterized protein (TIGR04222 family)|nr:TIGR04222 domain-containing membrane protein [Trichocoleus desertorum ATA4-8-CV12]